MPPRVFRLIFNRFYVWKICVKQLDPIYCTWKAFLNTTTLYNTTRFQILIYLHHIFRCSKFLFISLIKYNTHVEIECLIEPSINLFIWSCNNSSGRNNTIYSLPSFSLLDTRYVRNWVDDIIFILLETLLCIHYTAYYQIMFTIKYSIE